MAITRKTYSLLKSSKYALKKFAHSWSPLAAVFNNKPSHKLHLSILKEPKGLFDVPELTSPEGFYALKEKCEQETDNLISEAISRQRTRKMVCIFDDLSNCLCKVADLAEFIRIAHPDSKYSQTAELACSTVSSIVEKLNTNYDLYAALRNVVKTNDIMETTDVDKHVARLFLFDFEQCGIHLPENERREVVNLNNSILHLGQHFVSGSCNPRLIERTHLPENVLKLNKTEGDHVVMSGFHADSNDPSTREFAYRVFLYPEEHQEYLLTQLLDLRDQLAKMCGFKTYAERALRGSLAEDPATALRFLNLLAEALHPRAEEDFKTMNKMKLIDCGVKFGNLNAWDIPYYTHKIRRNTFNVVGDEYSPYFSLGACMDGLNKLMQSLFGISFVNAEISLGEAWDPSIYKLAVTHETEGLLGYIYCDFYTRQNKQNQDCHFTIQGGREQADGSYQLPVVVLMLNLPEPRWSSPSLLSPAMVDNLFHEMGHAMHSMLARTKYQHVTGTRCSTDFAEVPSVLMEYFANDPRVLSTFARHFQTGEPMPEKMLTRLCASKHLFAASDMQMQVFYSILDQHYHGIHPLPGTTTNILAQIQGQYYGIPYVSDTAWQLRFSHLVGYGAKYYSYLMSKAVASWIWQTYFEKDPFSRAHGDLYRYQCLNFGGGKPPRKLVSDFLQREFSPEKLVESLVKETDEKMKQVQLFNQKKG